MRRIMNRFLYILIGALSLSAFADTQKGGGTSGGGNGLFYEEVMDCFESSQLDQEIAVCLDGVLKKYVQEQSAPERIECLLNQARACQQSSTSFRNEHIDQCLGLSRGE